MSWARAAERPKRGHRRFSTMDIDARAIQAAVAAGLPARARWLIDGTTLDFDFSAASDALRWLPAEATDNPNAAASDLLVFGLQDFAECGGAQPWLCVRKRDGWVHGFDPDEDDPMSLLNSSIERFIATFRFLDQHLANNKQLPSDSESRLRAIDPDAYAMSDWRILAERLRSA